ncbi:MAG: hypothetical protein NTZ78_07790 [Candidatus Aureabacteria bacterium]|nr:hypothetical protein [Candidatus Auribacterota bacterium]
MKIHLLIPGVLIFLFATASRSGAGQAFFYINGRCMPPSEVDDHAGNKLKVGDLVQVIYSNGEIDPPDPKDTNYVGGNDQLLGNWAVGDDQTQWGDIGAGEFAISVTGSAGAQVYLRMWDAGALSEARYYGETAVYALSPEMSAPPDYYLPSFPTNKLKPSVNPTATPTTAPTSTPCGTPTPVPADTPLSTPVPVATSTP